MTLEEKHRKQFEIVKYMAKSQLSSQKAYIPSVDDFASRTILKSKALYDVMAMYRCITKLVDDHNSEISRKETLMSNLKYSHDYRKSALFNGLDIPIGKIDRLIEENPEKDWYELYRILNPY